MVLSATATRRSFLRTAAGLGVWGFLCPISTWAQRLTPHASSPLATKLARCLTCKDSAAVVGRAYLQGVPAEADVQLLVDLLCAGGSEQQAELACADKGKLREFLLQQQRQDFEHEHIVKVHGWLLSTTEARLCALATLL